MNRIVSRKGILTGRERLPETGLVQRLTMKEHKETLGNEGNVHIKCGYMTGYICQNSSNNPFNKSKFYCM